MLAVLAVLVIMLVIRVSTLNDRVRQNEDYLLECVTKDRLSETIRACLMNTAEKK